MELGTIGWGFSKMDGVPVGLVESQWGCSESQWGRLSMGMLQGVELSNKYFYGCVTSLLGTEISFIF